MDIRRHGGCCCGIRHIAGFGLPPETEFSPVETASDLHFYSDHASPGKAVTGIGPCPRETAKNRFKRMIVWLEGKRSQGIIEVVLATMNGNQVALWSPVLKEFKFKEVTPKDGVRNANTGQILHVYHRYSGIAKPLVLDEEKK